MSKQEKNDTIYNLFENCNNGQNHKEHHAQMCSGFNDCGISLTTTERRNTLIRTYRGKTFTVGDLTRCRSLLVSLEQNRELFLFNTVCY